MENTLTALAAALTRNIVVPPVVSAPVLDETQAPTPTKRTPLTSAFVLAGKAIFTVSNGKGSHYTFRVQKSDEDRPVYFIGLLTGSDNTHDYTYLGLLDPRTLTIRLTKASKYTVDSVPVKALVWALLRIKAGVASPLIRHENLCGRCGLKLTTPASISTGFGPECADKLGIAHVEVL